MAYLKKDEDADGSIVKVDRTSVFQEGLHCHLIRECDNANVLGSSSLQLLPYIPTTMQDPTHEDHLASVHRGKVLCQRIDDSVL